MASIGIDLGTSNTMVAYLSSKGEPEILQIDNEKMIPSCIYIEEPAGYVLVGKLALDNWADPDYNPANSFRGWKPAIGEEKVLRTLTIGGDTVPITPDYLTTCMVQYIVDKLTEGLGGRPVDSVLVTVPHGWRRENPQKCRATRLAAAQAKIGDKNITVQQLTISEPVAAAAYYMWDARKRGLSKELQNQTLLICDIGGGTFDLSLVKVGTEEKPLDVIDAVNNNTAGDYVDALLCAWVCREFNDQFATDYPTSAEEVQNQLEQVSMAHLRDWLLKIRAMKHKLSDRVLALVRQKRTGAVRPVQEDFLDPSGHHLKISLGTSEFESLVEPFYSASRELIREFLSKNRGQLPYAVLMAGGGSRMLGVQEHILEPALRQFYTQQQVSEMLERTPVNWERSDESIALGAALIANGVVSVQERLLNDIGIIATISDLVAQNLNLPPREQQVLIVPILAKGTPLPAVSSNAELGLQTSISPGESLDLEIVVDDGSASPWIQRWTVTHPAGGRRQSVDWEMSADMDGGLTLRLQPAQGNSVQVIGQITYTGRARLVIGENLRFAGGMVPRVTPEKLREAIERLRGAT